MAAKILSFPVPEYHASVSEKRQQLLTLRLEDVRDGEGTLYWSNGFDCRYTVTLPTPADDGDIRLEAYGRPMWQEIWIRRSIRKDGVPKFRCHRCRRDTRGPIYINSSNNEVHDWNCGCEFSRDRIERAATLER